MRKFKKIIAIAVATTIMITDVNVSSAMTAGISGDKEVVANELVQSVEEINSTGTVVSSETPIVDDTDDGIVEGGDSLENAVAVEIGKEYTTVGMSGWYKITTPENVSTILLGYDAESSVEAYDGDGDKLKTDSSWDERYKVGEYTMHWNYDKNSNALKGNTEYYFYIETDSPEYSTFKVICEERFATEKEAETIQLNQEYSCRFLLYYYAYYAPIASYYKFVAPTTGTYKLCLDTVDGGAGARIYQEGSASSYLCDISTESNVSGSQQTNSYVELKQGRTYYVRISSLTAGVMANFRVGNKKVEEIVLNETEVTLEKGEQFILQPTIKPAEAIIQEVTYKSMNPKVAIVNEDGYITTVGAGSTTIVCAATDGSGVTAQCKVTVNPEPGEKIPEIDPSSIIEGGSSQANAVAVELGKEYTTIGMSGWYKITTPENVSTILLGYDAESSVEAYDGDGDKLKTDSSWDERYKVGEYTMHWNYDKNSNALKGNTEYYFYIETDSPEYSTFKVICEERFATEKEAETIQLNQEYSCRFLLYYYAYYAPIASYYKFVAPTTGTYKLCLDTVDGGAGARIYQEGSSSSYLCDISTESNVTGNQQEYSTFQATLGRTYYIRLSSLTAGVTASITVSNKKVNAITLNKTSLTLDKNQQAVLTANVQPQDAVDKSVTYTSSNTKVALVSTDGTVTAVNPGTAVITCKSKDGSNVTAKCTVTVNPIKVNKIVVYYYSKMYSDQYFDIETEVYPEDASNKSLSYTSSNPKVATVSANGRVTAVSAGTTTITCKAKDGSNKYVQFQVTVENILRTGTQAIIGDIVYEVTSGSLNGTCEVSVLKVSKKSKKSYTIPNTVKINGFKCKVTGISANAFSGCTKATKITVGKNVKKIGSKAFYNCKKLKTLTINSSKIKSVGSNAFKKMYGKAKIKVPSSKVKYYKKLFAKKGQKSTVKITKK